MLNSILNLNFMSFSFEMTNEIQVYNSSNLHNIIAQRGRGESYGACCSLATSEVIREL